jgi:hypothetical protein
MVANHGMVKNAGEGEWIFMDIINDSIAHVIYTLFCDLDLTIDMHEYCILIKKKFEYLIFDGYGIFADKTLC